MFFYTGVKLHASPKRKNIVEGVGTDYVDAPWLGHQLKDFRGSEHSLNFPLPSFQL
jgi:hypothetical protein